MASVNSKTSDSVTEEEVVQTSNTSTEIVLSPMDKLKNKYEYFVIRNDSSTQKEFVLAGGDSVHINPNRTQKILSSQIIQFPDKKWATLLIPTLEDLQEVGLIKVNPAIEV